MKKRIWLITGASSGLGKSLAEYVIDKNDFVIATFRNSEQADSFNRKYKGRAKAIILDVSDQHQVTETIGGVVKEFGTIDILVNNAGRGFVGAVEEASLDEIRSLFEVNLMSTLHILQHILPVMRENRSGHIFQISSQAGIKASAGFGIYNSTKFALEGYSEAMAEELAPLGIYVTIVEPGPFRTNFAGQSLGMANAVINDYNETAGIFRNRLKSISGLQEGDPAKAAKAIWEMAGSDSPTLRLPLGRIAVDSISMKLESLRNDLEKNRLTALNAVFDETA